MTYRYSPARMAKQKISTTENISGITGTLSPAANGNTKLWESF